MGRVHLMRDIVSGEWRCIEEGVDYIGALNGGKVSCNSEYDMIQADSIEQLLEMMHEHDRKNGNVKWMGVLDIIYPVGAEFESIRHPLHKKICPLAGWVKELMKPRKHFDCDGCSVRYISELWMRRGENHIIQVRNFQQKAYKNAVAVLNNPNAEVYKDD